MGRFSYQDEPGEELRAQVWAAREFTPLQLFRVGAWKSAQGLGHLTVNPPGAIEERTRSAMQLLEPINGVDVLDMGLGWGGWSTWETAAKSAMCELFELDGVRYRMGTAILCFLAPAAFPVIDRHTAWAVWGPVSSTRWSHTGTFTQYTRRLVEVHATVPEYSSLKTVHEVDQRVMNIAQGRGTNPREEYNLLGFDPVELSD